MDKKTKLLLLLAIGGVAAYLIYKNETKDEVKIKYEPNPEGGGESSPGSEAAEAALAQKWEDETEEYRKIVERNNPYYTYDLTGTAYMNAVPATFVKGENFAAKLGTINRKNAESAKPEPSLYKNEKLYIQYTIYRDASTAIKVMNNAMTMSTYNGGDGYKGLRKWLCDNVVDLNRTDHEYLYVIDVVNCSSKQHVRIKGVRQKTIVYEVDFSAYAKEQYGANSQLHKGDTTRLSVANSKIQLKYENPYWLFRIYKGEEGIWSDWLKLSSITTYELVNRSGYKQFHIKGTEFYQKLYKL